MKMRIQVSRSIYRWKLIFSICLCLSLVVGLDNGSIVLAQTTLPGTTPLTAEGDLAEQMVEGIKRYLLRETDASIEKRARLWKRNYGSLESYDQSVASNREHFAKSHRGSRPSGFQSRAALGRDSLHPSSYLCGCWI